MPFKNNAIRRAKQKIYHKRHYRKNRELCLKKAKQQKIAHRLWFQEFKQTLACTQCGENCPACLDFHHFGKKERVVSKMVACGFSRHKILEEISLCVVLCTNCHRKLHAAERKK